jgi:hypothetical protein
MIHFFIPINIDIMASLQSERIELDKNINQLEKKLGVSVIVFCCCWLSFKKPKKKTKKKINRARVHHRHHHPVYHVDDLQNVVINNVVMEI